MNHHSRRIAFFGCLLLCIVTTVGLQLDRQPVDVSGQPQLVPRKHFFGVAFQNEALSHEIILKNPGDSSAIIIEGIKTSCRCTTVTKDFLGRIIEPGTELKFPVGLNTGMAEGTVGGLVTVVCGPASATEDSAMQFLRCEITANVIPDFVVSPTAVAIDVAKRNESILRITPRNDSLRVTNVTCNSRDCSVRLRPRGTSVRFSADVIQIALRADAQPQATIGRTATTWLTVQTNSLNTPTFQIPVRIRYSPIISVVPSSVVISKDRDPASVTLEVTSKQPSRLRDCRVLDEHAEIGNVMFSADFTRTARDHVVQVEYSQRAALSANILITLGFNSSSGDTKNHQVSIPFHAL